MSDELPTGTWAIVIADAEKAHARERAAGFRQILPREIGTVHAVCDARCPDGNPDCEHCGDPAFREACLAAGHCPHCVALRHGMAPDTVLEANGYVAVKA